MWAAYFQMVQGEKLFVLLLQLSDQLKWLKTNNNKNRTTFGETFLSCYLMKMFAGGKRERRELSEESQRFSFAPLRLVGGLWISQEKA